MARSAPEGCRSGLTLVWAEALSGPCSDAASGHQRLQVRLDHRRRGARRVPGDDVVGETGASQPEEIADDQHAVGERIDAPVAVDVERVAETVDVRGDVGGVRAFGA